MIGNLNLIELIAASIFGAMSGAFVSFISARAAIRSEHKKLRYPKTVEFYDSCLKCIAEMSNTEMLKNAVLDETGMRAADIKTRFINEVSRILVTEFRTTSLFLDERLVREIQKGTDSFQTLMDQVSSMVFDVSVKGEELSDEHIQSDFQEESNQLLNRVLEEAYEAINTAQLASKRWIDRY